MSTEDDVILEDDFICFRFKNNSDSLQVIERNLSSDSIQFHFVMKGNGTFMFNQGTYSIPLSEETGLTLYNPQKGLPIHL